MSSKTRKTQEALQRRIARIRAMEHIDTRDSSITPPFGSVMADHKALAHNNTYDRLPVFYMDRVFVCRDCGREEIWTASQQKWWYEEAKGNINATAVRCRPCRKKRKNSRQEDQP